jgi:hypothetical protein
VGTTPEALARDLRDPLSLARGVETGTYLGDGARRLAGIFDHVFTIELAEELAAKAARELSDTPAIEVLVGDSRVHLPRLAESRIPTFWFLDGHWSGGATAGSGDECPVLDEINALRAGHEDDCIVIDDARLFLAAPPPPHDASQWPAIAEVFDRLREARPGAHVTVFDDQVVCVPARTKPIVDRHVQQWVAAAEVHPGETLPTRVLKRLRAQR